MNFFDVSLAFQYVEQPDSLILGFMNQIETRQASAHDKALIDELRLFTLRNSQEYSKHSFSEFDVLQGLTAVINVWHPFAEYENTAVNRPDNQEIYYAVRKMISLLLEAEQDNLALQQMFERIMKNRRQRLQRTLFD